MSTRQYEQHLFDEYYDLEMLRNISQCIKIMSMQNKQQNTLGELYQAFNSICDEAHNTLRSIEEYTNELENVQLSNRKLDEEIAKKTSILQDLTGTIDNIDDDNNELCGLLSLDLGF